MKHLIKQKKIFPLASGSALQDVGIESFLEKFDQLTVTGYSSQAPFAGRVYKIRHDSNGTRITFIKALVGTLKIRDAIRYGEERTLFLKKLRKYVYIMEASIELSIR